MKNFEHIHIGDLISKRVKELGVNEHRICSFLKCTEKEIGEMYRSENLSTKILLRWSKLLEYDFFRIYSQHLILFSPPSSGKKPEKNTQLPQFRKNLYTKEIIDFILELIEKGEKTKEQIIREYKIPKTTLYKWIHKQKK
ncbi:helix-turn-helix domain-containing protein [Chryseobacterium tongliaoense]|uniref:helix-turn-helix domain-containing protein n=1 Tax=Chryseobacterium tongliaoense TaxID=3240933 RepID=UPI0035131640